MRKKTRQNPHDKRILTRLSGYIFMLEEFDRAAPGVFLQNYSFFSKKAARGKKCLQMCRHFRDIFLKREFLGQKDALLQELYELPAYAGLKTVKMQAFLSQMTIWQGIPAIVQPFLSE
jgi:hypothetical protein